MDEMELLQQILESSEDVEVPESLKPENIEKKLRAATESKAASKETAEETIKETIKETIEEPIEETIKETSKTVSFTKKITRYSEMAAAVCVLIIAGFAVNNMRNADTVYKKSVQEEEVPFAANSVAENTSGFSAMSVEKDASYKASDKAVYEDAYEEEAYEKKSYEVMEEADMEFCEDMDAAYDYGAAEEACVQVSDEKITCRVEEDGSKIVICGNDSPDQPLYELCLKEEAIRITDVALKEKVLYVTLSEGSEAAVDVTDPANPVFVSNKLVWK